MVRNRQYFTKEKLDLNPIEFDVLKICSRRWDVGMWTGSGWPRIGTGGGRL